MHRLAKVRSAYYHDFSKFGYNRLQININFPIMYVLSKYTSSDYHNLLPNYLILL